MLKYAAIGDFDIDYSKPNSLNSKTIYLFKERLGLKQLIQENTRKHTQSVIDFFTNSKDVAKHGVLTINLSDHLPIYYYKEEREN